MLQFASKIIPISIKKAFCFVLKHLNK